MKKIKVFSILALLTIAFVDGCKKEDDITHLSPATSPDVLSQKSILIAPQTPVNLGASGNYAILSKSGITDVYPSMITGNIGTSPITGAAILLSCPEVLGAINTVNAAGPYCRIVNPSGLTGAIGNMQTAYVNAAGRTNPNHVALGAGNIGGMTLTPGLYKWSTGVIIPTNVTLNGSSTDVWIFQIAGTLTMSSAKNIILTGGAKAKNIFWQVAGTVTIGTTAHFEGIILAKTSINMRTGSSINGRLYAQTAVTLQKTTVVRPL